MTMKNGPMRRFSLTTRMSSRRLMRQLSALSLSSTLSADQPLKPTAEENTKPKKNLTVRFDEGDNEVHFDETVLTEEDLKVRWYMPDDLADFKQDCGRIVRQLTRGIDGSPSTFARCVQKAYNGSTPKEVTRALKDVFLDESIVGLEGWMLRPKQKDNRRAKVMEQLQHWHGVSLSDESTRAEKIRAACRLHSKPSVYFAAHIAEKAFNIEDPEDC